VLDALAVDDPRPPGRALRELLASFDRRLGGPLRYWEGEQAACLEGRAVG
jgi:hypothetical protein